MDNMKESHSKHISQQFNQDLSDLRNQLLNMGGVVEKQVADAVEALISDNTEQNTATVNADKVKKMISHYIFKK